MKSLEEAGKEITESFEKENFSVIRTIFAAITIVLAILLLFDPFEHFTFHVRVLGLEMLSYLFVRKHSIKSA